jgi:hypothetical protein
MRREEANTTEIEITPEMIAAGRDALLDSDYGRDSTVATADIAASIIFSALRAAGFCRKMP